MSFGFGIGDLIAVSKITHQLWKDFKGVPDVFEEVGRQLGSFHIVLVEIENQINDPNSLINQADANRKDELLSLCGNLFHTLKELNDLFQRYKNMGRSAWGRFELGRKNLSDLHSKLTMHIQLIQSFMDSITIGAVGRIEPIVMQIYSLLQEWKNGKDGKAGTVLSAHEIESQDTWTPLELELVTENIPIEYLRNNRDQIRLLLNEVMSEPNSEWQIDDVVRVDDSISNRGSFVEPVGMNIPQRSPNIISRHSFDHSSPRDMGRYSLNWSSPEIIGSQPLDSDHAVDSSHFPWASTHIKLKSEEEAAIKLLLNAGFDVRDIPFQVSPPPARRQSTISRTSSSIRSFVSKFPVSLKRSPFDINAPEKDEDEAIRRQQMLNRALRYSINYELDAATRLILDKGGKDVSETLLIKEVLNGNAVPVSALLKHGGDASVLINGMPAICVASQQGNADVVAVLIKFGANPNARVARSGAVMLSWDERSETALHLAAKNGHVEVAQTLLEKGASFRLINPSGFRSLHVASWWGHVGVTRLLLEYGAPANEGADVYSEEYDSEKPYTALECAKSQGHDDVVAVLMEFGAGQMGRSKRNLSNEGFVPG